MTSLLAPLATGKAVYLLPEGLAVDLLTETLRAQGHGGDDAFSLIKITPAHLQLIGQQLAPDEAAGRTHAFIIGGENLLAEHVAFWHQNAPQTRLFNEYGPTETVVGCCVYEVPGGAELGGSVAIGRPIINTRLYVLDKALRPVPIGVPGELYIGGAGVARGYHNRPELTAERFLPDPFAPAFDQPGIVVLAPPECTAPATQSACALDGNLEYLGRLDEQIKIRGFRVELGEIEGVLTEHPAIKEAAVVTRLGGRRQAAGRVRGVRGCLGRDGGRPARVPGPAAARLHGSGRIHGSSRATLDGERQSRPARARAGRGSGARPGRGPRGVLSRALDGHRRNPGGHLV